MEQPINFQAGHYSLSLAVFGDEYVVTIMPVPGGPGCEPDCSRELLYKVLKDLGQAVRVYQALKQAIQNRHAGRVGMPGSGFQRALDQLSPQSAFEVVYRMTLGLPLR